MGTPATAALSCHIVSPLTASQKTAFPSEKGILQATRIWMFGSKFSLVFFPGISSHLLYCMVIRIAFNEPDGNIKRIFPKCALDARDLNTQLHLSDRFLCPALQNLMVYTHLSLSHSLLILLHKWQGIDSQVQAPFSRVAPALAASRIISLDGNICQLVAYLVLASPRIHECWKAVILKLKIQQVFLWLLSRAVAGMEHESRATLRANIPTKWPAHHQGKGFFQLIPLPQHLKIWTCKPGSPTLASNLQNLTLETALKIFQATLWSKGKRGVIKRFLSVP